ncbi:Inner membrane protein YebE [Pseudovibrio sp. W64]|uniref:tellurite resistance TerB family protein n=1 Tax=unclassified Pseudovibrio TaxID=2627060 RepID=UPI0007AEAE8D|nr:MULTISPECIES: tellurite resistance TerB family protein [unclassified Pseudovibrio]KZK81044.1 Inner membrane protein YebE [Pseudovibrio sp. W64]KZL24977.1 Inner membrane protein YebE [Pseudovibrio sp. WM33]
MFDSKALLDQFLGSNGGNQARGALDKGQSYIKNNAGGLAGGAVAGGLAGYLLGSKKGKKLGKKAVKYGGMALVGGLAYKAFQTWQDGKNNGGGGAAAPHGSAQTQAQAQAAPATVVPVPEPLALPDPTGTAFDPDAGNGDAKEFAMALIVAMIQAAKADGTVDGDEMQRIFEKLDELGLGAEEKAFVLDEMRAPLDIDRVVAFATCPETAAEIYTASRLAIDPNLPAEQAYLMMLAARLELDSGLVTELDKAIAAAQAQA